MIYKFGPESESNLVGVHPGLVKVVRKALSYGLMDFSVPHGLRTEKEQDDLYAQGRTKPGKVVTWTRDSEHEKQKDGYAHAVDLVPFIKGRMDWNNLDNFKFLATLMFRAAMETGFMIEWLGHADKPQDWGHFQVKD